MFPLYTNVIICVADQYTTVQYLLRESIKKTPEEFGGEVELLFWCHAITAQSRRQAVVFPVLFIVIGQKLQQQKCMLPTRTFFFWRYVFFFPLWFWFNNICINRLTITCFTWNQLDILWTSITGDVCFANAMVKCFYYFTQMSSKNIACCLPMPKAFKKSIQIAHI